MFYWTNQRSGNAMVSVPIPTEASPPVTLASHHRYTGFMNRLEWICHPMNKNKSDKRPILIDYACSCLALVGCCS